MDDRERFIALNLVPGIGSLRLRRLLDAFGSLSALWTASAEQLQQVEGIGPALAQQLIDSRHKRDAVTEELGLARKAGCTVVTLEDGGYPAPLRQIHDPPLVIYMKGAWTEADETAVAMVGARRASLYGQQMAERLAYDLALRGVTVVSGLARGIDGAAHRGALKASGRTLAVLGNGLSSIYPLEHKDLAEQIAERGALLSEYPMRMEPLSQNFPRRNRLISGLSLGVVIVEAAQRSGALITADCALEQGREVFAVPGKADSVTSQGTHQLLKQGARLVTSVDDILEELRLEPCLVTEAGTTARSGGRRGSPDAEGGGVTEAERLLLAALSDEPLDLDTLSARTGLSASACAAALLGLELKRLATQLPGKRFVAHG